MNDDVPLICDLPPGPQWVLTVPGPLNPEQVKQLRVAWDDAMRRPHAHAELIVLEEGMKLELFPGRYEWPDAEFCAA